MTIADSAVQQSPQAAAVLLLHPDDNVLVCVRQLMVGDKVDIDGETVTMQGAVGVGHKIARRNLAVSDKVLRYGAPIGSMTEAAAQGEHVHIHNMKSDYLPSHTRSRQTPTAEK